ncbi:MAG TPA: L-threonylcarbamoyladenylate synthase [Gemmataceae bacterium]|nr:L-threonylcarbamoyladenylate synthase [Gemmataceae bacterium]
MTEVLEWHNAADSPAIIRRTVKALAEGHVVAFPTETVYGLAASALLPEAVERLCMGKGRSESKPLALAIRGSAEARDWVPQMSPLGWRLARRCWPGPLTLVFADSVNEGLASRLPERVRQRVCPSGTLGLRTPAHAAIWETLCRLPGPLALSSANRSGEPAATTAEEVRQSIGEDVALLIDDGPTRYRQASTVVQVNGNAWSVLREGVLTSAELELQACCLIVFVCTGNTCRSPLAEVLCKKLLAERLGCTPEELPHRGFMVMSAGLAASMGGEAAPEAIETARELGADLRGHMSRPLTAKLVAQADFLITMTNSHLLALASQYRGLGPRPRLLSEHDEDLPDPIGCEIGVYQACARQILRDLEALLPQFEMGGVLSRPIISEPC